MDDLKSIYRQALPGRIEVMETAQASADREASAATIRRVAHALRGSGGTYGFPEISAAAAAVEDAEDAVLRTRLDHLIALLRSVAADGPRICRILIVEDEPEHALLM